MNNNQDLVVVKKDVVVVNSTTTKALYIVVTEDPTVKSKQRNYLALRRDIGTATVEISGFEVTNEQIAQIEKAKTVADATQIANVDGEINSFTIPWQRVIRIRNIVFNNSKKSA